MNAISGGKKSFADQGELKGVLADLGYVPSQVCLCLSRRLGQNLSLFFFLWGGQDWSFEGGCNCGLMHSWDGFICRFTNFRL